MNVFDKMGNYWAEISDKSSTDNQIIFLRNALEAKGLALDLCCGTGRHLIPLAKCGYSIVGLDLSPNLLKIAKNRFKDIQLVRGDMRFLPFKPGAFSSIVSMDTSFGYLPSEPDDVQSLIEVKKTLHNDGLFIIDVFNREYLMQIRKRNKIVNLKLLLLPALLKLNCLGRRIFFQLYYWKEYPSFCLLQKRTITKNGEKLCDQWIVINKTEKQTRVFKHLVRLYKLESLQVLLEMADFKVDAIYGGYGKQNFGVDSHRLILIASAK